MDYFYAIMSKIQENSKSSENWRRKATGLMSQDNGSRVAERILKSNFYFGDLK